MLATAIKSVLIGKSTVPVGTGDEIEAIAAAAVRKIVTVQPWVESRDGKRYLHLPPDAGYRNLVREMPPQPGAVPQTGR